MRKRVRIVAGFYIDDPGHRRFRQFGQLELLAERLNVNWEFANTSNSDLRETYDAYKIVEKIVSSDSLVHAAELFKIHAAAHPIKLEVGVGRMRYTGEESVYLAFSTPQNEFESSLDLLWRSYFYAKGWKRLKSCPICHKWFVDHTSDTRKARCSEECTNQWWNYDRRKEADYTRFKKGGYHGTKRR